MLALNVCFVILFAFWYIRAYSTGLRSHWDKKEEQRKKLFFAPFLGIAFRCYIPMTISSYLNISFNTDPTGTYVGENMADYYAVFIWLMTNFFFPLVMLYVALCPKDWLLDPRFK
jgi:hypothetical protein